MFRRRGQVASEWLAFLLACAIVAHAPASGHAGDGRGLAPILDYISASWDALTRSMTDCQSIVDPKVNAVAILYLPAGMAEPPAVQVLSQKCNVQVEHLAFVIHRLGEIDTCNINPAGLLYLPNEYVVPGGRFNEM